MDFEKRLAKAVLDAAKIREESYDRKGVNKAMKSSKFVDFTQFYTTSMQEAANKAAENVGFDKSMTQPIYLLIRYTWGDIIDWEEDVVNQEKEDGNNG